MPIANDDSETMSGAIPTKINPEAFAEFLETVLSHLPSTPEKDYRNLCDAWRRATGAEWIWLWMLHTHPSGGRVATMQLVARTHGRSSLPRRTHFFNPTSAAAYSAQTGAIQVIEGDFSKWSRTIGATTYSVSLIEDLEESGCRQFVCVPIHMPPLSSTGVQRAPDNMPIICATICFHYKNPIPMPAQVLGLLRTMAQASAQALLNSYQALQRTVLLQLDEIAHRHLTARGKDSETLCSKYAQGVIQVICQNLQVKGVSLFYRDSLRGGVQCLATTGLVWSDGRPTQNVAEVHYDIGEGRTGMCYQRGEPLILLDGFDSGQPLKTIELIDGKKELAFPATLYPIPIPKDLQALTDEPRSLGVIRCKYHHSSLLEGTGLLFDSIELQTLGFIAQQIAPVLETMELNIARERVVRVTKHDLNAPIGTIYHKTFGLRVKREARVDDDFVMVKWYDIHDIGLCTMMCLNLITQLDDDPYSFIPNANLEQISIEGRIIAPLKNMLAHYAKEENNMRIQFSGFDFFPHLWLDSTLMQRVIFNLLTNAVKYGQEGSAITIIGHSDDEMHYIEVMNFGDGVASDEVAKIFTPKFRSPRTAKSVFGLGLGLAIARACLEKCNCALALTRPTNPTTFSVCIPRFLENKPAAKNS